MIDGAAQEVDLTGFKLPPDVERIALTEPRFADVFLDYDVPVLLACGYVRSGYAQGMEWLAEVHVAVKSHAIEIAQQLLRDDGEGALATWNTSEILWPARAITKMPDGTWQISGAGGRELVLYPERLREFLLDVARYLVHAVARGAAILH